VTWESFQIFNTPGSHHLIFTVATQFLSSRGLQRLCFASPKPACLRSHGESQLACAPTASRAFTSTASCACAWSALTASARLVSSYAALLPFSVSHAFSSYEWASSAPCTASCRRSASSPPQAVQPHAPGTARHPKNAPVSRGAGTTAFSRMAVELMKRPARRLLVLLFNFVFNDFGICYNLSRR
jgi:hypothetical protein